MIGVEMPRREPDFELENASHQRSFISHRHPLWLSLCRRYSRECYSKDTRKFKPTPIRAKKPQIYLAQPTPRNIH